MKQTKYSIGFFLLTILLTFAACSEVEEVKIPPTSDHAVFSYAFDVDNPNKVTFTANPNVLTWYTHWDFGDNSSAEGLEATKVYFLAGEYDVRFKIFTEGGTAETIQTISIESDIVGPNLIQNGTMDGDDFWTVLPISGGVAVAFENGTAHWTGGGWGHEGIYQEIEVEADQTYQINMDIAGSGLSDCWFEVYVGTVVPMPGVDYTDGGIRLGLNTWDGCGSDPFEGQFTALSCSGGDGTFEFTTAVTAYLVIRGGGADYGTSGVTVDNVTIRAL